MKKFFIIFIMLFSLFYSSCKEDKKIENVEIVFETLDSIITEYYNIGDEIKYPIIVKEGYVLDHWESTVEPKEYNPIFAEKDLHLVPVFTEIKYTVTYITKSKTYTKEYSNKEPVDLKYDLYDEGFEFIGWSYNKEIVKGLKIDGKDITLEAMYKEVNYIEELEKVLNEINIKEYVTSNKLDLPTLEYPYELQISSSNEQIIRNDGTVLDPYNHHEVSIKLILIDKVHNLNISKNINVQTLAHNIIVRSNEFNKDNFNNVHLNENNKLVLDDDKIEGSYESDAINALDFNTLVGSWSCVTSKNATCEFLVKIWANNTWGNYISYCPGGWGQGLQNKCVAASGLTAKLVDDEIKCSEIGNKKIMFKIILRRDNISNASPELSLINFALTLNGLYPGVTFDTSTLRKSVKYDVPQLYQKAVPDIGGSICSPTSCTMLLKYKGFNFSDKDEYEHRYIASLAYDHKNKIYGNWVFNTVTMGSFGVDSYCKMMYSTKELMYHLDNIGPVAASMKGTLASDKKTYSTSGHLIDILGYEIDDKGNVTFISNDPNVPEVECRYTEQVFNLAWRKICYVIE